MGAPDSNTDTKPPIISNPIPIKPAQMTAEQLVQQAIAGRDDQHAIGILIELLDHQAAATIGGLDDLRKEGLEDLASAAAEALLEIDFPHQFLPQALEHLPRFGAAGIFLNELVHGELERLKRIAPGMAAELDREARRILAIPLGPPEHVIQEAHATAALILASLAGRGEKC